MLSVLMLLQRFTVHVLYVSSMPPCNWIPKLSLWLKQCYWTCACCNSIRYSYFLYSYCLFFPRQCLHRAFPNEHRLCWAVGGRGPRAYFRGGRGCGWAELWPTGEIMAYRDEWKQDRRWLIQSSELPAGTANQHVKMFQQVLLIGHRFEF